MSFESRRSELAQKFADKQARRSLARQEREARSEDPPPEACEVRQPSRKRERSECERPRPRSQCDFAFFFALLSDNPNPIPPNGPVSFSGKGASSEDNDSELIERVSDTQFLLKKPGTYEIYFQATISSPSEERSVGGALGIAQDLGSGPKMVVPSIVFSDAPFTQISNDYLLRTRQKNVVISIRNPPTTAGKLPLVINTSPNLMSGGASLKIKRIFCETDEDVERASVEP